jgi:hypothetical protein
LRLRRLGVGVRSTVPIEDKKLLAAGSDTGSKSAVGAGRRAHG